MIVSIHTNGMYMAWRWNMARNKYPEQTVEKILEVSLKLFSEKGYEKTTMQDIVNALGMSKGAIITILNQRKNWWTRFLLTAL